MTTPVPSDRSTTHNRLLSELDVLMQSIETDFPAEPSASEFVDSDSILGFYGINDTASLASSSESAVSMRSARTARSSSHKAVLALPSPTAVSISLASPTSTGFITLGKLQQCQFIMSAVLQKHSAATGTWTDGFFALGEDANLYEYPSETALDVPASAILPITSMFPFTDPTDGSQYLRLNNEFKQLSWSLKFEKEETFAFWLRSLNKMLANPSVIQTNANWGSPQLQFSQHQVSPPSSPSIHSGNFPVLRQAGSLNEAPFFFQPRAPSSRSNSISQQYVPRSPSSFTIETVSSNPRSPRFTNNTPHLPPPGPPYEAPPAMSRTFSARSNSISRSRPPTGPTVEQRQAAQNVFFQAPPQQHNLRQDAVEMMRQKSRQLEFADMDRQFRSNLVKEKNAAMEDTEVKAAKMKAAMGL
ncbi:hypothetical protein HDU98_011563 [Podochytrium sp. JEL0797]|nr:hypothetical protein HDU98_011563 [Podochytrium sp. JEL0797]